jgi:hypothetical protein
MLWFAPHRFPSICHAVLSLLCLTLPCFALPPLAYLLACLLHLAWLSIARIAWLYLASLCLL